MVVQSETAATSGTTPAAEAGRTRALIDDARIEPENVTVRVHDSNADMRYVVIPMRPPGTQGWSEEQLADVLTRDTLVGVTVPRVQGD